MAIRNINFNDMSFKISYDIVNPSSQKNIIFLHGWGSNKEIMQIGFKDNLKDFRHIYIDLMGFGKSSNEYILNTFEYAKIIDKFLNEIKIEKDMICAHSFGGKIATLLNPKLLILLSSAGIIEEKPWSVKIKISTFKFLKKLGFKNLKALFVASDGKNLSDNMYETFKLVVDEDFSKSFAKHKNKTLIFWGVEDKATTLRSGEIINKLIKNSEFYPLHGDHYFFLKHSKFITDKIGEVYGRI